MQTRIAVLASGSGTNLQAILDYNDSLGAIARGTVVLVASDRASSGALDRVRERRIAAAYIANTADAGSLDSLLAEHDIQLVVLAGYLKLVPREIASNYRGRMLNIHPALLPAFGGAGMYGARVHRSVLESGARVTGATVHFVDEDYDRGAIIAQWPVPVAASDTADTLAARVLRVEHILYPRIIDAVAGGQIRLEPDGRCTGTVPASGNDAAFGFMRMEAATHAANIENALSL